MFRTFGRGSDSQHLRVDSHPDYRIDSHGVQSVNFLLASNPAGHNELLRGKFAQARRDLEGKPSHEPFAVDMRVKKCRDMGFELGDRLIGGERDLGLPSLHRDVAVLSVDAGDYLRPADVVCEFRKRTRYSPLPGRPAQRKAQIQ